MEFVEDDFRNISGRYDAFVSIGMLEHVGVENYPVLGDVIKRVLKPDGRGLIHSVGRNPLVGLAAAFAGVSGGFSANLLLGTIDPLLAGISQEAARIIDLMLDRVAFLTAGTDHLMDPRFLPLLSEDEVELREALLQLAQARTAAGDALGWERVEALLKAHEAAGAFLDKPADGRTLQLPSKERPGTMIGPYKLLQLIGEGGFGVVYMAEQTEPVARKVALKIIKLGMDTRQVIARFEAERQALALMDHPNIAKMYGRFEAFRTSFIVMEFWMTLPKSVTV